MLKNRNDYGNKRDFESKKVNTVFLPYDIIKISKR